MSRTQIALVALGAGLLLGMVAPSPMGGGTLWNADPYEQEAAHAEGAFVRFFLPADVDPLEAAEKIASKGGRWDRRARHVGEDGRSFRVLEVEQRDGSRVRFVVCLCDECALRTP